MTEGKEDREDRNIVQFRCTDEGYRDIKAAAAREMRSITSYARYAVVRTAREGVR